MTSSNRAFPLRVRAGPPRAFTLIELLVVISIIAILATMLVPGLGKAKRKGHTIVCGSNMKSWLYATEMYSSDQDDHIPHFGDSSTDQNKPFWHGKLAPYLMKKTDSEKFYASSAIFTDSIRRCPGGSRGAPPYYTLPLYGWNCWIGAHFGGLSAPFTAPFYYADRAPALKVSSVKSPSNAMLYTDTLTHFVYTPRYSLYRFTRDADHDGVADSMTVLDYSPFNFGRPTVHNNGANAALLDGHVERVPFKRLWAINPEGEPRHRFWRLE